MILDRKIEIFGRPYTYTGSLSGGIYVSGPMSGKPDLNKDEFKDVSIWLAMTYDTHVINPHTLPKNEGLTPLGSGECTPLERACFLREDFQHLSQCNNIVLLPEWESSVGASCELSAALMVGLHPFTITEDGQLTYALKGLKFNLGDWSDIFWLVFGHVWATQEHRRIIGDRQNERAKNILDTAPKQREKAPMLDI